MTEGTETSGPASTSSLPATSGTTVSIGAVRKPATPRPKMAPPRSPSGERLDEHALSVVAAALAAPALFLPVGWLIVCSAVALGAAAIGPTIQERKRGSADLLVVPVLVLRRLLTLALSFLHPMSLLSFLISSAMTVAVAVLVPAGLAALRWVVLEGGEGVMAAARQNAWTHAPRLLSALICFGLVRGQENRYLRSAAVQRRSQRLGESTLTGIALAVIGWVVIAALALPMGGFVPFASGESLVNALPGPLEDQVIEFRLNLARSQADAVLDCLYDETGYIGLWIDDVSLAEDGTTTVAARYTPEYGRPISHDDPVIVLASLHNQLAPWVSSVTFRTTEDLVLDRRQVAMRRPVVDADSIEKGVTSGSLPAAEGSHWRDVVLACSASHP